MDWTGVVIDNGSSMMRAGLAGDDNPRLEFTTLFGNLNSNDPVHSLPQSHDIKRNYIGDDVVSHYKELQDIQYPIQRGIVTDWDAMEKIYQYIFHKLGYDPAGKNILHSEPLSVPRANREKLVQSMFETFNAQETYISLQGVLSSYCGRGSNIVVDIGEEMTQIVPIIEGFMIEESVRRLDIGGKDVTNYLFDLINEKQGIDDSFYTRKKIQELKENECSFVRYEKKNPPYILPDGTQIILGEERFLCPYLLLNPSLNGIEGEGIQHAIASAISACPIDLRSHFLSSIEITGGSSQFYGFESQVRTEIKKLFPRNSHVKVFTTSKRNVWLGGSILASLSNFRGMWIDKSEYEEHGPNIAFRKCRYVL